MTKATNALWTLFDPNKTPPEREIYSFDYGENADLLVTKINIALAIGRPLLLTGRPGVGKSSVARAIAEAKGWQLFKVTINSRTEADDLKATFDDLSRLADANVKAAAKDELDPIERYMAPGVLWQAYNPLSALDAFEKSHRAHMAPDQLSEYRDTKETDRGRVLLIDEIDKGDLDFANDLLDAFDRGNFVIPRTGQTVGLLGQDGDKIKGDGKLLVVITSNEVRTQSEAFQRRCLPHTIEQPGLDKAVRIGEVIARSYGANEGHLNGDRIRELAKLSCDVDDEKVNTAYLADLIEFVVKHEVSVEVGEGWEELVGQLAVFARSRILGGKESQV